MNGQSATILIVGAGIDPVEPPMDAVGSKRVPVADIKANLRAVMKNVSELVHSMGGTLGDLNVAHVDVGLAIAGDGSVGLVGIGGSSGVEATLKVRLQFSEIATF